MKPLNRSFFKMAVHDDAKKMVQPTAVRTCVNHLDDKRLRLLQKT